MPTDAYGNELRRLCFTPEDDALLARGYPHLRRLVDGHKDDREPEKAALEAAYNWKWILRYRVDWPRELAQRFVRLAPGKAFQDWQRTSEPDAQERAQASREGPVSVEEARDIVAATLPTSGCTYTWRVAQVDFLLEAMVGADPIVDALVTALEALPEFRFRVEKHGPDRQLGGHTFGLGFLLRRVTSERRARYRARLQALWDKHHTESKAWEVITELDRVLHGAAAMQGKQVYNYLDWHAHVHDDPELLRRVIAEKETVYADLDVQFAYLAGAEVLDLLGKHRPRTEEVRRFLEDIGLIQHPTVVSLMLQYLGKKSAKDLPLAWFRSHADYARPILEGLAKSDPAAQEALEALDAAPKVSRSRKA